MTAATFDTHAAVKALTDAGFNAKQAETITDTVRDAVAEGGATKADIAGLHQALTAAPSTPAPASPTGGRERPQRAADGRRTRSTRRRAARYFRM